MSMFANDPTRTRKTSVATLLRASPLPPLEARVLLAHALGWRRTELITRADEPLDARCVEPFRALEARRARGEPIAQLTGAREFYGLEFRVMSAVLIPRPETELLVDAALDAVREIARPALLDLGTGSGALAVALAATRPDARIWATERAPDALAVATENATRLLDPARPGGWPTFLQGDWYGPLGSPGSPGSPGSAGLPSSSGSPGSFSSLGSPALTTPPPRFDVIVSNPPYIAASDPHLWRGDLRFEPRGALTDEADGLSALRAIATGAPDWLAPRGALWMEHGYDQAQAVRALFASLGFADVRSVRDLAGIERITGGRVGEMMSRHPGAGFCASHFPRKSE